MKAIRQILVQSSTSISELKKNPRAVIQQGEGFPVAVLNRNKPEFYCVPEALFEKMTEQLENMQLLRLVAQRKRQSEREINIAQL
jgi:antitoxin StbD